MVKHIETSNQSIISGDYIANEQKLSARQRERRVRVLDTTLRLLNEHGHAQVTMDQIATESGVAKKTLYLIHGNKEQLITTAVETRVQYVATRIACEATGRGLSRLFLIVRLTCEAVLEFEQLSRSLEYSMLLEPGRFSVPQFHQRLHGPCLQEMKDDGYLVDWADLRFLLATIMVSQCMIQNLWAANTFRNDQLEPSAMLDICRSILPFSTGHVHIQLIDEVRHLQARLADWHIIADFADNGDVPVA